MSDGQILGSYWFELPGVAGVLGWIQSHLIPASVLVACLVLIPYLPWRRARFSVPLTESLARGQREPRRDGRSNSEYFQFGLAVVAAFASLTAVGVMYARHAVASGAGFAALGALAWSIGLSLYFVYRLYDGRGVPEPSASMYALSGRLYLVSEFPALDCDVQDVKSAIALRTIAEKFRMPVLHTIDPDTGQHEFLLITVQKGCFRWAPHPAPAASPSGSDPSDGSRPPTSPRGKHSSPTTKPGSALAFQTHSEAAPIVGGALTSIAAGSVLGFDSVRPLAIASVAGLGLGLSPVGRHAERRPQFRIWRVR